MNNDSVYKFKVASKESMTERLIEYANDVNKLLGLHLNVYQLNDRTKEALIGDLLELANELMRDSMIMGANSITDSTLTALRRM